MPTCKRLTSEWHAVCNLGFLEFAKENAMALADQDLTCLAGKVVHDSEKLLSQQVDLFRAELGQEFRRLGDSAFAMVVGVSLATGGIILAGLMLANLLQLLTDWPSWCCYGLIGAACVVGGVILVRAGRRGVAQVQFLPQQTAQAVKENLTWLKQQITGPAT